MQFTSWQQSLAVLGLLACKNFHKVSMYWGNGSNILWTFNNYFINCLIYIYMTQTKFFSSSAELRKRFVGRMFAAEECSDRIVSVTQVTDSGWNSTDDLHDVRFAARHHFKTYNLFSIYSFGKINEQLKSGDFEFVSLHDLLAGFYSNMKWK